MVYKHDYWLEQSPRFSQPHYRLLKGASIINSLSQGKGCDLLDVGCGPAGTLSQFLDKNISYYGIDGFITEPAPNLIQKDLMAQEIGFANKSFDLVSAFGFFEYMDKSQHQKLSEIRQVLNPNGKFITSFINFRHRHPLINAAYNNQISIDDFMMDLKSLFHVDRMYPTSYNWIGTEPQRDWLVKMQMPLKINIPLLRDWLAVQFLFICSKAT